jgi:hypothetical protein
MPAYNLLFPEFVFPSKLRRRCGNDMRSGTSTGANSPHLSPESCSACPADLALTSFCFQTTRSLFDNLPKRSAKARYAIANLPHSQKRRRLSKESDQASMVRALPVRTKTNLTLLYD